MVCSRGSGMPLWSRERRERTHQNSFDDRIDLQRIEAQSTPGSRGRALVQEMSRRFSAPVTRRSTLRHNVSTSRLIVAGTTNGTRHRGGGTASCVIAKFPLLDVTVVDRPRDNRWPQRFGSDPFREPRGGRSLLSLRSTLPESDYDSSSRVITMSPGRSTNATLV